VVHAYVGGVNRAKNSSFITSKTEKLLTPTMKNYSILWAIQNVMQWNNVSPESGKYYPHLHWQEFGGCSARYKYLFSLACNVITWL